ncbi:SMI1/KNR4 family protein [Streptomyces sp. TLI_171]|uniref:SMI1/KNR4 family protein n=1 Tax=Streptomyces sp. TLI_171 TaxID=1938859 RepID=UPI000C18769C|nr:SMI1/KNR4 family protein [Streptomyces sp. TLI_171]RKE17194.1 hypothetical protein BX266_0448 [Streptomyces sp. TLI_171]
MSLDRLRAMMPSSAHRGEPIDWAAAELAHGPFPSDYREFVDTYGAGSIDGLLGIGHPLVISEPGVVPIDVAEETDDARLHFARVRTGLPDEVADASALRGWGDTAGADTLAWIAVDPDPDRWPVVVWSRSKGEWLVQGSGMADFLVGLLAGELAQCPLSDLSLWGRPEQEYIPWWEER